MNLIECRDLTLTYDRTPVVTGLTFSVSPGDILCVVGENGSGKSTLIKTLVGLKKAAQGELRFSDDLKLTEIGYLPQQTEIQRTFPASVFEIVRSGCIARIGHRPFFASAERLRAEKSLEMVNLLSMRNRPYGELSGGQQQRVLLARAFCATEKLLILDEPTAGLDPQISAELYRLIREITKREGLTVVMVTHDIRNAVAEATHVLHLIPPTIKSDGNYSSSVAFFGTADDYLVSSWGQTLEGVAVS